MSKYSVQLSKNLSEEAVIYSRRKQNGKFKYWNDRKFKDIENVRRIQKILAKEERS